MPHYRILSTDEAMTMLRLAGEYYRGKRKLPPEIVAKRKEIEAATRNAELFMINLRVVDVAMVDRVVQLKLELDTLYGSWAISENGSGPMLQ